MADSARPLETGRPFDSGPEPDTGGAPSGANVLVVVADDLGRDRLRAFGASGDDLPQTPRLDRLARDGMIWTNVWSQPVCSPTRAELLSGRRAARYGLGNAVAYPSPVSLPAEVPLLPSFLPDHTAAFVGKWHLTAGDAGRTAPLAAGFSRWVGSLGNLGAENATDGLPMTYFDWEKVRDGEVTREARYATTDLVEEALGLVDSLPEPWAVVLSFQAPHAPFHRPPAELVYTDWTVRPDTTTTRHSAMVEAMDHELGRLLDGLGPDRVARTWVAFLADNGSPKEVVGEDAKATVYEPGLQVPLILSGPGVVPGSRSGARLQVLDLLPTLIDLLGEEVPGDFDGQSFAACVADPKICRDDHFRFAGLFSPNGEVERQVEQYAADDGRYKLVMGRRCSDGDAPSEELFDLMGEGEGRNLLEGVLEPSAEAARAALEAEVRRWVSLDWPPCPLDTGSGTDTGAD